MRFEITIDKFTPPGIGLGFFENRAIFVPASAPGDRLLVELTKDKKDHAEARILEILAAGEERIEASCPHYSHCGGCDLMHLSYERQLTLKAQLLKETLKHHGIDWQEAVVPSPSNEYYRYKASLKLGVSGPGFNRRQSEEVVDIPHCKILAKPLIEILPRIASLKLPVGDLSLLASRETNQVAGMIHIGKRQQSLPGFHFAVKEDYGLGSLDLWAANFAQANPLITALMLGEIGEASKSGGFALELYAGSGTLTLALAKAVPKVLALEANPKAVKLLQSNMETHGLENVSVRAEIAKKSNIPRNADLILVDPPRVGMERVLTDRIIKSQAGKLIYMSCNPASQASDLKLLIEKGGFQLKWLKAYDMYCHSSHLETLALLER
ncbi:MAG: RsmD family RNA methyltransferase [Deltaproteobacteria bacterium]|nr:RsmD family RNA methyltransferase [Deltaproteobacteria bacterium]